MAKVALRLNEQGKLEGLTPADERAYARFKKKLGGLTPGDTISFEHRFPRSPKFHRRHFTMLGLVFDNQEVFDNDYQFRKWTEVGAGHFELVPGFDGQLYPLPKSINYESLDDTEFAEVHYGVVAFLRSRHATRHLWPHVSDAAAGNAIESILSEFGA